MFKSLIRHMLYKSFFLALFIFSLFFSTQPILAQVSNQNISIQSPSSSTDTQVQNASFNLEKFTSKETIVIAFSIVFFLLLFSVLILRSIFYEQKSFSRSEILSLAWKKITSNMRFFIILLVIENLLMNAPNVIVGFFQFLFHFDPTHPVAMSGISLIIFSLFILSQMVLIKSAIICVASEKITIKNVAPRLREFIFFVLGFFAFLIIVFLGFAFLVVPGIILFVRFSLWPFFILDKKANAISAFLQSWTATRGHTKDLFFLYILLFSINSAGAILMVIGLYASIPFTVLAMAQLYKKLTTSAL